MTTHFVRKSGNAKLGHMSATYRTQDTCPTSCPFLNNGCYARGRIFASAARFGTENLTAVADRAIAETPTNGILRFEVSGDVTADDPWITECNRIVAARPDIRVIRYTHSWRELSTDMFSYPVNASCETAADIEQARAAGWQTVVVGEALIGRIIAGSRVVQCPQQTVGTTCSECRACSQSRTTTIAFVPHGSGRKKVLAVVGR